MVQLNVRHTPRDRRGLFPSLRNGPLGTLQGPAADPGAPVPEHDMGFIPRAMPGGPHRLHRFGPLATPITLSHSTPLPTQHPTSGSGTHLRGRLLLAGSWVGGRVRPNPLPPIPLSPADCGGKWKYLFDTGFFGGSPRTLAFRLAGPPTPPGDPKEARSERPQCR